MLTINRKEFTDAFLAASRCVPSRTTIDILKNVMVVAKDGEVALSATDSENEIQVITESESTDPIRIVIPADRFASLLKEVDGDELKLDVKRNVAHVECGDATFNIPLMDVDAFPAVAIESSESIAIPGSRFLECVQRTVLAVDDSSLRYSLCGIQINVEDGRLVFVGTDERRIGVDICSVDCVGDSSWLIPKKLCQLFIGAVSSSGDVLLSFTDNRMVLRQAGRLTVAGKYLAGSFPKYKRVLLDKPNYSGVVTVPPKQLAAVIRRAMVTSAVESRGVTMSFSKSEITVENETKDIGSSTATMPCSYSGEDITLILDGKYAIDALSASGEGVVDIGITDDEHPVVFTAGVYRHAVMPLYRE